MNVIRHQYVGMQVTGIFLYGFTYRLKIEVVIFFLEENRCFIITPDDDVLRLTGKVKSGKTGHFYLSLMLLNV